MKFYSVSEWTHGCVDGGHDATSTKAVRTLGRAYIGIRSCTKCDATQRMMEYASSARARK